MKWIFIFLFFTTSTAFAVVDMKNASFADVWTDLIAPGPGYDLKVRRGYKSRSLYNGLFGFGWCSDFESHLKKTPEGNLKLTECRAGIEIVYTPKSFSPAEIKKTVAKIITSHKRANRNLKRSFYREFTKNLTENIGLRTHFAKLYKIRSDFKKNSVFYANGKQVDRISFGKGVYTRFLPDNTQQKFNLAGQLIYTSDKNGSFLKLSYDNKGLLRQIHDTNGRKLTFRLYKNSGKVKEITGPHNLKVSYKYKGDNLISVKNAWNHSYSYAYDDTHNLVRINFPDKTFKKISYNQDKDWVTSFRSRDGCVESYNYKPRASDPQNNYVSSIVKKCGKKIISRSSYEFWHKKRKDGQTYLARVLSKLSTETLDVHYHPIFGKPVQVGRNNHYTYYKYYSNGLLKEKENKKERLTFEYSPTLNKVTRLTRKLKGKKGKLAGKVVSNFKYNKKANLVFATTSEGHKIRLQHDKFGRISQLIDQAKRVIKVKYEGRFGKPSYVERVNGGAIRISYKQNGNIKSVKSKSGPLVATQVSEAFNSLLQIIEPATEEYNF